ncbi:hypothetical protein R0K18_31010, partial [Pantoea sp. SIMBA_133]
MFDTSGTGDTFLQRVSVNQEVKANPATNAASSTNSAVSNGDIAITISDLKNKTLSFNVANSNVNADASVSDFSGLLIS